MSVKVKHGPGSWCFSYYRFGHYWRDIKFDLRQLILPGEPRIAVLLLLIAFLFNIPSAAGAPRL